mmetsp:Transcript_18667/g.36312  ORF Transcript_18667/g.36312 Transcript_18667/m.36312 type:complete len:274 (-) Transcript_18667:113-934(-)
MRMRAALAVSSDSEVSLSTAGETSSCVTKAALLPSTSLTSGALVRRIGQKQGSAFSIDALAFTPGGHLLTVGEEEPLVRVLREDGTLVQSFGAGVTGPRHQKEREQHYEELCREYDFEGACEGYTGSDPDEDSYDREMRYDVAVGTDGAVFVLESEISESREGSEEFSADLQIFDHRGNRLNAIRLKIRSSWLDLRIALRSDREMFVTGGGCVHGFSLSGGPRYEVRHAETIGWGKQKQSGQRMRTVGIAADASGRLFVGMSTGCEGRVVLLE